MSRMFPKSPSLGALTHRAWTEERAGPRSWDWGTRCQHATLRVAGAPAKHSPGRSTASRSGISQKGNASSRAPLAPAPRVRLLQGRLSASQRLCSAPCPGTPPPPGGPGPRAAGRVDRSRGDRGGRGRRGAGLPPPAGRGPRGLAQRLHTRVGVTRARSPSVAHRRSTRPSVCGVAAHRPGVCRRTGARTEAPDDSGQGVDREPLCTRRDGREDGVTGRDGPSRDTPRRLRARAPPAAEPPSPGAAARPRALVRGSVSAPFLKEQLTFTDLTCFIQDCRAQMRPAEGREPGPADPKPSSEDEVSCRSR